MKRVVVKDRDSGCLHTVPSLCIGFLCLEIKNAIDQGWLYIWLQGLETYLKHYLIRIYSTCLLANHLITYLCPLYLYT